MHGEIRTRFEASNTLEEAAALSALIEGAVALNMLYLAEHPRAERDLARAGIRYERPVMCEGLCQVVDPIHTIRRKRFATCFSVAAWVTACERFDNGAIALVKRMPVWAFVNVQPQVDGFDQRLLPHVFHAVVQVPSFNEKDEIVWTELDPTRELPGFAEKGLVAV